MAHKRIFSVRFIMKKSIDNIKEEYNGVEIAVWVVWMLPVAWILVSAFGTQLGMPDSWNFFRIILDTF